MKYVILIVLLCVCYLLGQSRNNQKLPLEGEPEIDKVQQDLVTVTPALENQDEGNSFGEDNKEGVSENKNPLWSKVLEFEGDVSADDNPWGTTAGYISIEDKNYIFLTPNTSVYLNDLNCAENLELSFGIYEAMSTYSDGAGLIIWILDANDNIIYEEEILVTNEVWTDKYLLLSRYTEAERIKILCNNGTEDSDDGDWVLVEIDEEDLVSNITETVDYVKAVHYFSDSWPIDFWNSELDDLEVEMQQIRQDGFNTVVLVLPWKEFQTSTMPIEYNDYPFDKLTSIVEAAERNDLYVIVRIGYTWDFYNDVAENVLINRYYAIMHDENVKIAWLDYAAKIYDTLSGYKNFLGGFMCWEDFWNNVYIAKSVTSENNIELARQMGYQTWIKDKYSLEEISSAYDYKFSAYEDIFIPDETETAFYLFFEFYDEYLNSLLVETQQVFPDLSMEVRVDADLVYTLDGPKYYGHESTYTCADSDFTTIVYGIPMGFENKGERVSALEAVEMTGKILSNVNKVTQNKALFIDQFLFVDNTPAFAHNAQVKSDELDLYLDLVSKVLVDQSWGYGVWTYKDYMSNMLYNSEFALGTNGWTVNGNAEVQIGEDSNILLLSQGTSIEQTIPTPRNHFGNESFYVQLDILTTEKGTLRIQCANEEKTISFDGSGTYTCSFDGPEYYIFKISAESEVKIDNIRFYSHIQEGEIYTVDNQEDSCITGIREMNATIEALLEKRKEETPYYSLIDKFNDAEIEGKIESADYMNGVNFGLYYEAKTNENAIYVTPDVSFEYEFWLDDTERKLSFSYEFFELSKEWGSDGAVIELLINGDTTAVLNVSPKDTRKEFSLDLSKYMNEKVSVKFVCKQGGDNIGDWILIYEPKCN